MYDKTSPIPKFRQQYLPNMRKKASAGGGWGPAPDTDARKHFRCRSKRNKADLFVRKEDFDINTDQTPVAKEEKGEDEEDEEGADADGGGSGA